MTLENTQNILKRLRDKYSDTLQKAILDIKPRYSPFNDEYGPGIGYVYHGIDDRDRDFTYNSLRSLEMSVNGALSFDIEHFVTYENAVKELDQQGSLILNDLNKLKSIEQKYKDKEIYNNYPIVVSLTYHQEIYDILENIFNSAEYKEFKNPGQVKNLIDENNKLKFLNYWRTRKRKYIIHLIAFIPFLFLVGWTFTHKDTHDLVGLGNTVVLIISGLITIIFNLFFNNHNSFKDAWKLLSKKSRQELMKKEEQAFLQKK